MAHTRRRERTTRTGRELSALQPLRAGTSGLPAGSQLGRYPADAVGCPTPRLTRRGCRGVSVRTLSGTGKRWTGSLPCTNRRWRTRRCRRQRDLWESLLQVAFGDLVEHGDNGVFLLFVRHTYLAAAMSMILQTAFGIDVEAVAGTDPAALLSGDRFRTQSGVAGVIESDFFGWPTEVEGGDVWLRALAERVGRFGWSDPPGECGVRALRDGDHPTGAGTVKRVLHPGLARPTCRPPRCRRPAEPDSARPGRWRGSVRR